MDEMYEGNMTLTELKIDFTSTTVSVDDPKGLPTESGTERYDTGAIRSHQLKKLG